MDVYFLEATVPLTKRYTQRQNGEVEAESYPHVADFKSHKHQISVIERFERELTAHAALGHCLLKGQLTKELNFESRAGSTNPNTPTEFLVIDVDGAGKTTPDVILSNLGIQDVSYVVQYSSSQGVIEKKGLSCHIFVLLDRPIVPSIIKQWLIKKNIESFRDLITLTRSGVALHYPIDITACQNDKLIYITPPICTPASLDKFNRPRIQLITHTDQFFSFPDSVEPQQMHQEKLINELRKAANLPPRRTFTMKMEGTQQYMPKPDQAEVTGVKEGRGFVYLNLNGGDSWAYWHPSDNFEYIFNFKGEPAYRTAELVPTYYVDLLKARRKLLTGVRNYYIFRDPVADAYFAGWHDPVTGAHEFNSVSSKDKLKDFVAQYALPTPKVISDWTCTFDPFNTTQVDPKQQYWNRFTPSIYMLKAAEDATKSTNSPKPVPRTISRLIAHVLGTTEGSPLYIAFLNWLATAFQLRRANGTAWILQGVPGTGKGILVNQVIKIIFGATNYTARRMEELEDKFNGYLENCLIVYVDEVHVGVSKRADMIMANLKNQITEPRITIRNMRQTAYERPNYLNWIFSSNMTTPIQLDRDDRRFNVGAYQNEPLRSVFPDTSVLVHDLALELADFGSYLAGYKIDVEATRVPIRNDARQDLIDNSKTSLDVVGDAMLKGDMATLATFISVETDDMMAMKGDQYRALLQDLVKTGRDKLSRDEIRTIFLYTVGDVPLNPAKLTRFLGHRGIKLKKIRIGDKTTVGIEVQWVISDDLKHEILTGTAAPHLKAVPNDGLSGVQRSDG
jgi:Family of unknown function (DUF5906)